MLETPTASVVSIEALVRDLDVLIRARYPLVSVATFEEGLGERDQGVDMAPTGR